jgi:hypothetical protein
MSSFTLLRVGLGGGWAAFRYVKSVHVCLGAPWVHPPHPGRGVTITIRRPLNINRDGHTAPLTDSGAGHVADAAPGLQTHIDCGPHPRARLTTQDTSRDRVARLPN